MKKIVFFCLSMMTLLFTSCERDDPWFEERYFYERHDRDNHQNSDDTNNQSENQDENHGESNNEDNAENNGELHTIIKLYSIVMRREIPYPFKAYVLQIENGEYFYMLRYRFNQDLYVGDKISFSVYSFCPNEIAAINGIELGDGEEIAEESVSGGAGEYLVASDPIEATIANIFSMKVRYSLTLFPIDSWFILTTDGNLLYVKKSKVNVALHNGDRFVYNTYTLFPNEILAIKKL